MSILRYPVGTGLNTRALYDGNHNVPYLCGPPIRWVDEKTRAAMTVLRYRVRAVFYQPLPRGSTDAFTEGVLVEQPRPRIIGGDIAEYELIFATVPERPVEPLPWVFNYQQDVDTAEAQSLIEIPIPVTAIVRYRYINTAKPEEIELKKAWKMVQVGNRLWGLGERPAPGAKEFLAEDESIERWMGDIWEVRRVTVSAKEIKKLGH